MGVNEIAVRAPGRGILLSVPLLVLHATLMRVLSATLMRVLGATLMRVLEVTLMRVLDSTLISSNIPSASFCLIGFT